MITGRPASMFERLPTVFQQPPQLPAAVGREELGRLAGATSSADMFAAGRSGDGVRLLQRLLVAQRHDPGPDDGDFGQRTESAVRSFQRHRGLTVDGLVGPQTLGELTAPLLSRFLDGLQDVLDPVLEQLDNAAAYFDIATAPEQILRWWAWLLGADSVGQDDAVRHRAQVRTALEADRRRGTALGIRQVVAAHLGLNVDQVSVTDGGDTSWSDDPDVGPSGTSSTHVVVVVDPDAVTVSRGERAHLRDTLVATLPVGYTVELKGLTP